MTTVWLYSLTSVAAVSALSLSGAFLFLVDGKSLSRAVFALVALSVGALFGDVFLHLLPELYTGETHALSFLSGEWWRSPSFFVLGGILVFFMLEKFFHWRHTHDAHTCKGPDCDTRLASPLSQMVLVADGVHNLIDGLIIGASFLVSPTVGIATTLAVALHEIPQEIGDFGVLLHAGLSRGKALLYNLFSAFAAFAGVVAALLAQSVALGSAETIAAFAAGGFIYLAGSDLVPELHKTTGLAQSFAQLFFILLGIGLMAGLLLVE